MGANLIIRLLPHINKPQKIRSLQVLFQWRIMQSDKHQSFINHSQQSDQKPILLLLHMDLMPTDVIKTQNFFKTMAVTYA